VCEVAVKKNADSKLSFDPTLVAHKNAGQGGAGGESVRIVNERRSSETDLRADGSITESLSGAPRSGEEGTMAVCERLVGRLNADGGNWSQLVGPDVLAQRGRPDVDCEASDGGQRLQVQVTRAVGASAIWKGLAQTGLASGTY